MNLKTRLMWSGPFFSRFFFNTTIYWIPESRCHPLWKMLPGKQPLLFICHQGCPQILPLFRGIFVKVNLDFFPNICHPQKCFLWSFYFGVFLWIHDLLIRSTGPTTWWGRFVGQSYPINQHATPSQNSFMLKVTILTCQRWPNLRTQKHPCEKTGSFTLSIGGSTRGFLEKEKVPSQQTFGRIS